MTNWLVSAASGQWEQLQHFWCTPSLRIPIFNIWVATFGAALHGPCTTFFLLELGLSTVEIGNAGMMMSLPDLFLAPVYGWALDKFGAYPTICLTAGCCAFGCVIRGFALTVTHVYIGSIIIGLGASNLWVSVLSHISQHTEPAKREACVSAFVFQVATLRIVGKASYFPCVWLLEHAAGVTDLFTRYRIMMVTCPFFCIFGWVALACCGGAVRRSALPQQRSTQPAEEAPAPAHPPPQQQQPAAARASALHGWPLSFVVIAAAVLVDAVARTSTSVAWPLLAKDRWGWSASEFAFPLFLESFASALLVFFAPTLSERAGGGARTSVALALVAALLAASVSVAFGTALMVALLGSLAMKDPCLRALGSLTLPLLLQGRAFAIMSATRSLGDTVGNWAATRLFEPATAAGASAPLLLAGGLLLLEAVMIGATFPLGSREADKAKASPPVTPMPPASPGVEMGGLDDSKLQERLALLPKGIEGE